VVALDSGYDPLPLARAGLAADLLVRLRSNRVFFGPPGPSAGRGAPRKYGARFALAAPRTHPAAARSASLETPRSGRVQVDAWPRLRARGAADVPLVLVRVQLERLPRRATPPAPLWLAWIGGELPADLLDLWRWYCSRFTIEHGFRFLKQALGWTAVRPRQPAAADRWSWLLALALWQLPRFRPKRVGGDRADLSEGGHGGHRGRDWSWAASLSQAVSPWRRGAERGGGASGTPARTPACAGWAFTCASPASSGRCSRGCG